MWLTGTGVWAAPQGWTEDFEAAKAKAQKEGKDLLLDFTGSDWCVGCVQQRYEVFDTAAFKRVAPQSFVLVEVDFPKMKSQDARLVAQNQALLAQYGVEGYPTLVLTDAQGRPYYVLKGYPPGGVQMYLKRLEALRGRREARDAAFERAGLATDDRAKAEALAAALEVVGMKLAIHYYDSTVRQIIALDSNDQAGLKTKYEAALLQKQLQAGIAGAIELVMQGDMGGGYAALESLVQEHPPNSEMLQIITSLKGQIRMLQGRGDEAKALFEQAMAVDPGSEVAAEIRQMIETL